jgi:hypothetical protein
MSKPGKVALRRAGDEMKIKTGVAIPQRAAPFQSVLNACPTPGARKESAEATNACFGIFFAALPFDVCENSIFTLPGS